MRIRGKSRGWELLIRHDLEAHVTTHFYKGTADTKAVAIVDALRACAAEIHHPLLLPLSSCS